MEAADNISLTHLERFEALLSEGQTHEAVETLRQLMETGGEKIVPLDAGASSSGFRRYVPLRHYCQMRLSALARSTPDALAFYRGLIDPVADQYWRRAIEDRDESALQRIVDRLFVSSVGDEALLRLGELALARGDWTAARGHWEQIAPVLRFPSHPAPLDVLQGQPLWLVTRDLDTDAAWRQAEPWLSTASAAPSWLVYPDTNLNLNDVRAKLVLVSILEGDESRASAELALFQRLAPSARGRLGGRDGLYVDLLDALLSESANWPRVSSSKAWPTFAGNAQRAKRIDETMEVAHVPRWMAPLPVLSAEGEYFSSEGVRAGESLTELLSYHPIVAHGLVVVQTGPRVEDIVARKLDSGEVVFGEAARGEQAAFQLDNRRCVGVPRYTLTAHEQMLYACVVDPDAARGANSRTPELFTRLIGLNLRAQGQLMLDVRLEREPWGPEWSLEGPPLCDGDALYLALRRRDTVHAEAHVACLDARGGRLRWTRMICGNETPTDQPIKLTHRLLSQRGGTLYCNTNLGAVAALRSHDGSVRWVAAYPQVDFQNDDPDRNTHHFFRDLDPCMLYRDLVIVAPMDCNRLFALDANTGQKLWSTLPEQAADAVHLLGVGQGRLLVSGDFLYWFDVYTGRLLAQFPAPRKNSPGHARPSPRGHGRGILAGDRVYWPTRESILVFGQGVPETGWGLQSRLVDGLPMRPQHSGGNLVIAEGTLLIATPQRLLAFDAHGKHSATAD